MYDLAPLKNGLSEIEKWLIKELRIIRTGRASPSILDSVFADIYGTPTQISHAGNISVEDARSLIVTPWDASQLKAIEKAISVANIGVGVSADSTSIRVSFPELTSEVRSLLIKNAKSKLEDARTRARSLRDEAWSEIQEKQRAGEMSEDEKFRAKDEMQSLIDSANGKFEELFVRKDKEISI